MIPGSCFTASHTVSVCAARSIEVHDDALGGTHHLESRGARRVPSSSTTRR